VSVVSLDDLPDLPLDEPLADSADLLARTPAIAPAPRWVAPVYIVLAVLLMPWTVYLGIVLPDHTTSRHWDVAWVGFDLAIIATLLLTGWFAYRRSRLVESSAVAAATLLIVDAWFDCTTASRPGEVAQALAMAFVVEIPLALLSLWIARHAEQVNETATRWLVGRSQRQAERLRRLPRS
jgi:hypothetical protein